MNNYRTDSVESRQYNWLTNRRTHSNKKICGITAVQTDTPEDRCATAFLNLNPATVPLYRLAKYIYIFYMALPEEQPAQTCVVQLTFFD